LPEEPHSERATDDDDDWRKTLAFLSLRSRFCHFFPPAQIVPRRNFCPFLYFNNYDDDTFSLDDARTFSGAYMCGWVVVVVL